MTKRPIINTDSYQGECRRNNYYMPPLTDDIRSWLPIFAPIISVIGLIVAIVVFTETAKATSVLAKTNYDKIDILRIDTTILKTNYAAIDKRLCNIEGKIDKLLGVN